MCRSVSSRESIGFLNLKESENGYKYCVSLLNRSIQYLLRFFDAPWSKKSWIYLFSKETQNLFSDTFGFENPVKAKNDHRSKRSFFTFIFNHSSNMNYFICTPHLKNPVLDFLKETHPCSLGSKWLSENCSSLCLKILRGLSFSSSFSSEAQSLIHSWSLHDQWVWDPSLVDPSPCFKAGLKPLADFIWKSEL